MFAKLRAHFSKFKGLLSKTKWAFGGKLTQLLKRKLDDETIEDIERILFEADLGSTLVIECIDEIKAYAKKHSNPTPEAVLEHLKNYAQGILAEPPAVSGKEPQPGQPRVLLIVGINGSGKTTTAAKLGNMLQEEGKKVLFAAGDTFRAAAIEQLEIWAKRLKLDIVKGQSKGDPAAVIFDALQKAVAKHYDIVIADTAGRLESKADLMQELSKVGRVCEKFIPGAPHEILLVIDATSGQNAVEQAKIFHEFAQITGIILTKCDGSAKGGAALSIYRAMKIPILFMGMGEGASDLIPFDAKQYVDTLFSKG